MNFDKLQINRGGYTRVSETSDLFKLRGPSWTSTDSFQKARPNPLPEFFQDANKSRKTMQLGLGRKLP